MPVLLYAGGGNVHCRGADANRDSIDGGWANAHNEMSCADCANGAGVDGHGMERHGR